MNSVGFSLTRPRRENKETCELFFFFYENSEIVILGCAWYVVLDNVQIKMQ